MADSEHEWEELRRTARKLEGDLDVKLSSYAKQGGIVKHPAYSDQGSGVGNIGGDSLGGVDAMALEIEGLLERLGEVNDQLTHCIAGATATTSGTQKLARHRDILHDFTQEFRRTRGNITSIREHAELLTSVRNDISEYKLDDLISHAEETKGAFAAQRSMFGDIQGRLKTMGGKMPVVRQLLGAISRRKSRDTLILSAVVAACTTFLVLYWLAK